MTLIITSQANREFAEELAPENAVFISPMRRRAVHGAERVIIVGGPHPRLERLYRGICPVECVSTEEKPEIETITPDGA